MSTYAPAAPEAARIPYRLGIWLFLASECVVFGALIGTYWALHGRDPAGLEPSHVLNTSAAAIATYLLLASSLTMAMALASGRSGHLRAMRVWMGLTILLGAGFVAIQAREYAALARDGLHLQGSIFGATFYALTGTHGAHVVIGLLWLAAAWLNALRGRIRRDNASALEFVGLYWHFVDMVWMIIFPVVYLMPLVR